VFTLNKAASNALKNEGVAVQTNVMDQETLELVHALAKKIVVDETVSDKQIREALTTAIEQIAEQTSNAYVNVVINTTHGGFAYSNEFIKWLVVQPGKFFESIMGHDGIDYPQDNDHSHYPEDNSLESRVAAAAVMPDFGRYMVEAKSLQEALVNMSNYFDLFEPLSHMSRYDLPIYLHLLSVDKKKQPALYRETVAKLSGFEQGRLNEILSAFRALAQLIGRDQLQDCFSNYRHSQRPHDFVIYIYNNYLKSQWSTVRRGHRSDKQNSGGSKTSTGNRLSNSIYQQFGLYYASAGYSRLEIDRVNRYRHWSIRNYDGMESITYGC